METKSCSKCGNEVKVIGPGVSKKTGKPYNAFYKCEGCGNAENLGGDAPTYKKTYQPYKSSAQLPEKDWDTINAKKNENISFLNARNVAGALIAAAIQKGELTLPDALEKYAEVVQKIYDIDGKQVGINDF